LWKIHHICLIFFGLPSTALVAYHHKLQDQPIAFSPVDRDTSIPDSIRAWSDVPAIAVSHHPYFIDETITPA
jgi:hypothetical protein